MTIQYHDIVFMQGDDADEPLQILDEQGQDAAVEYLAQWDYGTENEHSPRDEPPWGDDDTTYKADEYVLSWNIGLGYISLTRIEETQ